VGTDSFEWDRELLADTPQKSSRPRPVPARPPCLWVTVSRNVFDICAEHSLHPFNGSISFLTRPTSLLPALTPSSRPPAPAIFLLLPRLLTRSRSHVCSLGRVASLTLRSSPAGARFANSLIRAMNGESGVVEPTFVKSPLYKDQGVEYFASNVELGPEGVTKIHPVGSVSAEEEELIKACLPE
jgi:hypothetical protein